MRARTRALAVVSTVLLLSVLVWFNYSALLPRVVETWGLTGLEAGAVFAAFQAGYVVGVLPAGRLADRRSARHVVAAGATGTGLASLGFATLATGFASGTAFRFVAGVCMAGVYVPGMRFLSEWFPEEVRGRALGVYSGAFSLSTGLSFLLAAPLAAVSDWRVAVAATSVGAVLAGPLLLVGTRDHPGATTAPERVDLSLLSNRAYRYAVGVYAGHTWELFGARNWLFAFLVATPAIAATGEPSVVAGTVAGVVLSVGGLSNVVAGWTSDEVGRLRTVGVALGTSATLSLAFGLRTWHSLAPLAAATLAYGLALTADSSPTTATVTEVVADERVGVALALQTLVGFSSTVVSPVAFGYALDVAGYAAAFGTLAAGAAAGLLSLGLLSRTESAAPATDRSGRSTPTDDS